MRYLLAIFLPPVAMLTVGKPFQAVLCLILMVTLIGWPIAALWAILVVNSSFADTRNKKLIAEMQKQTEAQVAAARAAQAQAEAKIARAEAQIAQAQAQIAQAQAPPSRQDPPDPPIDPT